MAATPAKKTDPLSVGASELYFPNSSDQTGTDIRPYEQRKKCCGGRSTYIILTFFVLIAAGAAVGVAVAAASQDSSAEDSDDLTASAEPTLTASDSSVSEQKNVVLFILDDAGWADFSFTTENAPEDLPGKLPTNPYLLIETPNMDEFFGEGAFYSNYHSSVVCTPARASLFTGRYLHNLGMQIDGTLTTCANGGIPLDIPTWAEHTADRGYSNILLGKWNVGMSSWLSTPLGRGWHDFVGSLNHPAIFRAGYSWMSDFYGASYVAENAEVIVNVEVWEKCLGQFCPGTYQYVVWNETSHECFCTNTEPHIDYRNDANDAYYFYLSSSSNQDWWHNTKPNIPTAGKNADDLIMTEALATLDYLEDTTDPWTLTIAITTPHTDQSYAPNGTSTPIYAACEKFFDTENPYYHYRRGTQCQRMVELDDNFGLIVNKLKELDMWDDTLVMLTNDNAPNPGQSGGSDSWTNYGFVIPFRGDKGSWLQGGIQTVLGLGGGALPDKYKGTVQTGLADVSDIYPTILAAAGFTSNEIEDLEIDGKPLLDMNEVNETTPHEVVFHWGPLGAFDAYDGLKFSGPNGTVVRVGDWKMFDVGMLVASGGNGLGWYTLPADNTVYFDEEADDPCYHEPWRGCFYNILEDPFEEHPMLPHDVPADVVATVERVLHEQLFTEKFIDAQDYSTNDNCKYGNTIELGGLEFYPPWEDEPSVLDDHASREPPWIAQWNNVP